MCSCSVWGRAYFSQMVLILYEIWRKSGVFILHFCIRCKNFLTGKDDFFRCKWKIKSFFKHNVSCLRSINNFHFTHEQVLYKVFIFDNEACYIRTFGKDLCWGCTEVQKPKFSLTDVPENLRKWGIFYCCGHKVKRENYNSLAKTVSFLFCLKLLD